MKLNYRFGLLFASMILVGCQTPPPSSSYNITKPSQVAMDQLMGSRHYTTIEDFNVTDQFYRLTQHRHQAVIVNAASYEQILVKPSTEFNADNMNLLDDGLSRTCWSLREDAEIKMIATARRGVSGQNVINACVSKRLGKEYPLFVYSYVTNDHQIGEYLMLTSPSRLYSNNDYLCKLRREGYPFKTTLFCDY